MIGADSAPAAPLLEFLAEYGAGHPISFSRLRAFLARMEQFSRDPRAREAAGRAGEQRASDDHHQTTDFPHGKRKRQQLRHAGQRSPAL